MDRRKMAHIQYLNTALEKTLRKMKRKSLEGNIKRWKVVTLQIAININGHRGYPRKYPGAQQNIQEHIWSCVGIEFGNIRNPQSTNDFMWGNI